MAVEKMAMKQIEWMVEELKQRLEDGNKRLILETVKDMKVELSIIEDEWEARA